MDRLESVFASFGENQHRDCYKDLYQAISIEKEYQPRTPNMQELVSEVSTRTGKRTPQTIWRSLARAVKDLWDYGDKKALISYYHFWTRYRPKPQEFIEIIARYLWENERRDEDVGYGQP